MSKMRTTKMLQSAAVLCGAALLTLATEAHCTQPESPVPVTEPATAAKAPHEDGFIQRWLILDPIPYQGRSLGDSAVRAAVAQEYFPNQMTVIPKDGDKVTLAPAGGGEDAAGAELTWRAVDTRQYNINLYYFAEDNGNSPADVMFWAVTVVNLPEEVENARLAVGSNAAHVSWVNGVQATELFINRQTVIDDAVSKRLTLKKGANVIRCAVINTGRGASDFCARILGPDDKPLTNFTITLAVPDK